MRSKPAALGSGQRWTMKTARKPIAIAAAKALEPKVAEDYAAIGVTP